MFHKAKRFYTKGDGSVLEIVRATPDTGKMIHLSHGELIDGVWTEIIDKQVDTAMVEAVFASRADAEKLRDNKCLDLISEINTLAPALDIEINEPATDVMARAIALDIDGNTEALAKLLALEKIVPETLPSEKHVIGE